MEVYGILKIARVCWYFFEFSPSLSLLLCWNRRDPDLLLDMYLGTFDFAKDDSILLGSFGARNVDLEVCVDIVVKLLTITIIVKRTHT